MKLIFKNFTMLSDDEIVLVHEMRNSDAVRLKMYNQDIISLENHRSNNRSNNGSYDKDDS